MVQKQKQVEKFTNEQLAQSLVDMTNDLALNSSTYQLLMEAAYRLDPKSFEED